MDDRKADAPTKVAILCHGFMGYPANLQNILDGIENLKCMNIVLVPDVNGHKRGWFGHTTLDGVEICGMRLKKYMEEEIPNNAELYVHGHSFGGIYLRYALGKLFEEGAFEKRTWNPILFMTTASPHLGMFESNFILRFLGRTFGGQTGKDLFMDSQMLDTLAGGHYLDALRLFSRRIVIGNTKNDDLVGPATSLISTHIKHIGESGTRNFVPSADKVIVTWTTNTAVQFVVKETFAQGNESVFKQDYAISGEMFERIGRIAIALDEIEFERILVGISEDDAHVCIIQHATRDTRGIGRGVVTEICNLFKSASDNKNE